MRTTGTPTRRSLVGFACALTLGAILAASPKAALAADYTWTGGSTVTWTTSGSNWSPSGASWTTSSTDTAWLSPAGTSGAISGTVGVGGIVFTTAASQLYLNWGGGNGANSATLNLNNSGTINNSSGQTAYFYPRIVLQNGMTKVGSRVDFMGAITGTGNLNISGLTSLAGTLSYSGTLNLIDNTSYIYMSSVLPTGGGLSVASGATFALWTAGAVNQTIGSLSGAGNIFNNTATSGTVTVGYGDVSSTFSGVIYQGSTGLLGLTKTGTGTLTLSGANTYTGATTVNAGTLQIGTGGAAGSVSSSSVLTMGGASLAVNRSGAFTQSFASTTLAAGASAASANATNAVNFGAITRNVGAAFNLSSTGTFITSSTNTNGILGGGITVGGTTWAVANGASAVTGLTSYTTTASAGDTAASYANANVDVTSSQSPSGAISPNSVRFNTAGSYTLTLPAAVSAVTTGGILVTANVGNNLSTITGGTIAGSSGGDLVVIQNNTANGLTIASVIADNASPTGLTKAGNGTLTLSGNNTYSGATQVNAGVLALGASNVLSGSTAVTVAGGVLDLATFTDTVGGFTITSGTLAGTGKLTTTTYGLAGGTVNANLGAGTVNVTANSALNGTTDATALNVNSGTLSLGSGGRFTSSSVVVSGSTGGTLALGGNETIFALGPTGSYGGSNVNLGSSNLTMQSTTGDRRYGGVISGNGGVVMNYAAGSTNILRFNQQQTFTGGMTVNTGYLVLNVANTLATTGIVNLNGGGIDIGNNPHTWAGLNGTGGGIYATSGAGRALTLNVATGTSYTFGGVLGSAPGYTGASFAVVKAGGGTQVLSGANVYTGTTSVTGGILQFVRPASLYNGGTASWNAANISTGSGATLAVSVGASNFTTGNVTTLLTNLGGLGGAVNNNGLQAGSSIGFDTSLAGGSFTVADSIKDSTGTGGGSIGLVKLGTGTLSLTGTNIFTGATTISAGILSIGSTTGLQGTSGVNIAGGAGLSYIGGAAVFGRNITVTAGSGTGTVTNSGGGLLTLSGTLSKDNSVLRLTGGSFDVTGVITGTTVNKSDLVVDAASVQLSNTNTYNGPTYVYNSGALTVGVSNAIPNTSAVYLGNATSRGSLVLGSNSDTISQLIFSGSGGTLSMSGDQTASAQLATNGSLSLGSIANLVLTSPGTSAGLYRLITATSISGSFAPSNVTGVPTNYSLLYTGTGVDLQRWADQATTFSLTPASSRVLVGGSTTLTGSIVNTSPANAASLSWNPTTTGSLTGVSSSAGATIAAGGTSTITATFLASNTATSQSWSVVNSDNAAITNTSTASGSINVVNQRTFSVSSGTISLGNFLRTASMTGSTSVTSLGSYATTASGTLGTFVGSNTNGFTLTTTGSTAFNGADSQTANYSLSGSASSAGSITGSFTSTVSAELGTISPVTVALVGTAYDAASITKLQNTAVSNGGTISIQNAAGDYRSAAYVASTSVTGQGWSVTGFDAGSSAAAGATLAGTAHFSGAGLLSGTYAGTFSATFQNNQSLAGAVASDLGSQSWSLYQTYVNTSGTGSTSLAADTPLSAVSLSSGTGAGATLASFAAGVTGSLGANVTMSFTTGTTGQFSDILHLQGTDGIAQVLQLTYDPTKLGTTAAETLLLGWLDTRPGSLTNGQWINSVLGNTGTNGVTMNSPFLGSWATWSASNGKTAATALGAFGVDTTTNTVWAAVNHNSQFVIIVPEPGSLALAGLGIAVASWAYRRRK